ncbi:hypothetical protein N185_09335 [Sinorhizobium sp. GW3]|nr:hypothetical protein N185_09335 [Sinorhizobium sp. GW3]
MLEKLHLAFDQQRLASAAPPGSAAMGVRKLGGERSIENGLVCVHFEVCSCRSYVYAFDGHIKCFLTEFEFSRGPVPDGGKRKCPQAAASSAGKVKGYRITADVLSFGDWNATANLDRLPSGTLGATTRMTVAWRTSKEHSSVVFGGPPPECQPRGIHKTKIQIFQSLLGRT